MLECGRIQLTYLHNANNSQVEIIGVQIVLHFIDHIHIRMSGDARRHVRTFIDVDEMRFARRCDENVVLAAALAQLNYNCVSCSLRLLYLFIMSYDTLSESNQVSVVGAVALRVEDFYTIDKHDVILDHSVGILTHTLAVGAPVGFARVVRFCRRETLLRLPTNSSQTILTHCERVAYSFPRLIVGDEFIWVADATGVREAALLWL